MLFFRTDHPLLTLSRPDPVPALCEKNGRRIYSFGTASSA
jgi:hypothetical protein